MAYVKETRSRTVGRDYHKCRPGGRAGKGTVPLKKKGLSPSFAQGVEKPCFQAGKKGPRCEASSRARLD